MPLTVKSITNTEYIEVLKVLQNSAEKSNTRVHYKFCIKTYQM